MKPAAKTPPPPPTAKKPFGGPPVSRKQITAHAIYEYVAEQVSSQYLVLYLGFYLYLFFCLMGLRVFDEFSMSFP